MNGLEIWWVAIIFASPVIALIASNAIRRTLSARVRVACALAALAVLILAFTPISLSGLVADHIALSLAYAVLWVAIGGAASVVRYGAVGTFAVLVVTLFLRGWPVPVLIWTAGDATRTPSQTIQLGCHHAVRMVEYGWVAHSGTEVVAFTRPYGLPLELELGRRRFDDSEYEPAELSAKTIGEGTNCAVAVVYKGREVWSAP